MMTGQHRSALATTLLVPLAIATLLAACTPPREVESGAGLRPGNARDSLRLRLLRAARERYTYERNRDPIGPRDPAVPLIQIATPVGPQGASPLRGGRLVARLTNRGGKYDRLGLPPGVSYVWGDTLGTPGERGAARRGHRMFIVPESRNSPMMWLSVELTPQRQGDDSGDAAFRDPILLMVDVFSYQGCDPNCEVDHCTSRDAILSLTDDDARSLLAGGADAGPGLGAVDLPEPAARIERRAGSATAVRHSH